MDEVINSLAGAIMFWFGCWYGKARYKEQLRLKNEKPFNWECYLCEDVEAGRKYMLGSTSEDFLAKLVDQHLHGLHRISKFEDDYTRQTVANGFFERPGRKWWLV